MKKNIVMSILFFLLFLLIALPIYYDAKKSNDQLVELMKQVIVTHNVPVYVYAEKRYEVYFVSLAKVEEIKKIDNKAFKYYIPITGSKLNQLTYNPYTQKIIKELDDVENPLLSQINVTTKEVIINYKKCLVEILVNDKSIVKSNIVNGRCIPINEMFLQSKEYNPEILYGPIL